MPLSSLLPPLSSCVWCRIASPCRAKRPPVRSPSLPQVWASYSPVKNSVADAQAKAKAGDPTHYAAAGELDMYKAASLQLVQACGAVLGAATPSGVASAEAPPPRATFHGMEFEAYPRVVLSPSFAVTLSQCKVRPHPVELSRSFALSSGRSARCVRTLSSCRGASPWLLSQCSEVHRTHATCCHPA